MIANQQKRNRPINQPKSEDKAQQPSGKGVLGRFSKVKNIKNPFGDDAALKHVPFLIYLTLLGIVYIANNHYAEAVAGQITKMERDVKNLQMEYSTLKYEYMTASNKEEVAKKLEELGLVPNDENITKIKLNKE